MIKAAVALTSAAPVAAQAVDAAEAKVHRCQHPGHKILKGNLKPRPVRPGYRGSAN